MIPSVSMPLSFHPHEAALEEGKGLASMCTKSAQQRLSQQSSAETGRQQGRIEPKVGELARGLEG